MGTGNLHPEWFAALVKEHFDKACLIAFRQTSIISTEFLGPLGIVNSGGLGSLDIHADAGKFWMSISTPGHGGIINLSGQVKNRVAQDNSAFISGSVGKLIGSGHIPGCVNMFLTGSEPFINRDTFKIKINPDFFQAQAIQVSPAAHGHQESFSFQFQRWYITAFLDRYPGTAITGILNGGDRSIQVN